MSVQASAPAPALRSSPLTGHLSPQSRRVRGYLENIPWLGLRVETGWQQRHCLEFAHSVGNLLVRRPALALAILSWRGMGDIWILRTSTVWRTSSMSSCLSTLSAWCVWPARTSIPSLALRISQSVLSFPTMHAGHPRRGWAAGWPGEHLPTVHLGFPHNYHTHSRDFPNQIILLLKSSLFYLEGTLMVYILNMSWSPQIYLNLLLEGKAARKSFRMLAHLYSTMYFLNRETVPLAKQKFRLHVTLQQDPWNEVL